MPGVLRSCTRMSPADIAEMWLYTTVVPSMSSRNSCSLSVAVSGDGVPPMLSYQMSELELPLLTTVLVHTTSDPDTAGVDCVAVAVPWVICCVVPLTGAPDACAPTKSAPNSAIVGAVRRTTNIAGLYAVTDRHTKHNFLR